MSRLPEKGVTMSKQSYGSMIPEACVTIRHGDGVKVYAYTLDLVDLRGPAALGEALGTIVEKVVTSYFRDRPASAGLCDLDIKSGVRWEP